MDAQFEERFDKLYDDVVDATDALYKTLLDYREALEKIAYPANWRRDEGGRLESPMIQQMFMQSTAANALTNGGK